MLSDIQIIEKPDWVSWEEIKQCLFNAHSVNRAKGINMTHYQWPAEKIREYIGTNGKMFVALDGKKIVGTAAIIEKRGKSWYTNGRYAYLGFDGVIPEYNGRGIFKKMDEFRKEKALSLRYSILLLDTHEKNKKRIHIAKLNGYRLVNYFRVKSDGHCNVVMAKWSDGCPYSKIYCKVRFYFSFFRVHISILWHKKNKSSIAHYD